MDGLNLKSARERDVFATSGCNLQNPRLPHFSTFTGGNKLGLNARQSAGMFLGDCSKSKGFAGSKAHQCLVIIREGHCCSPIGWRKETDTGECCAFLIIANVTMYLPKSFQRLTAINDNNIDSVRPTECSRNSTWGCRGDSAR